MKNANQIRHLLSQVLTFEGKCTSFHPDSRAATQTYKWILEKIYNRIEEALALLLCETCNGTGKVPTPQSVGFGHENEIMDTCPDCQSLVKIKIPRTPTYWYCPTCDKWDSPRVSKLMATPEHQPYRGIDVGTCGGTMIPLYSEKDIQTANKRKEQK